MSLSSIMFVYTEINIFCIALLVMIEVRLYVSINLTAAQRAMRVSIWQFVVLFAWDSVWAMLHALMTEHRYFMENFMRSGYFILLIWSGFFWFVFDQQFMRTAKNIRKEENVEAENRGADSDSWENMVFRKHRWILLPALAVTALNAVNIFKPFLFTLGPDGAWFPNGWTAAEYLFPAFYVILSIVLEAKYPDQYQNVLYSQRLKNVSTLVACALAEVQAFRNNVPLVAFAITFSYFICYISMQDESISVDALTHLNNRRQFTRYLNMKMHEKRLPGVALYLMIMDVDFFKEINDTYGHVEGDAALIRVADTMRKCGEEAGRRRMQLSRYGGDEFIIVLETSSAAYVEKLKKNLQATLDEKTQDAGAPYEMKVSIGVAEYNPGMKNVNAFLSAADEELYKVKQRHHSRRSQQGA